jgi:hypothetical protein
VSDPYKNARSDRRYGGTILADGKEIGQTAQCKHCGDHFMILKGSGRVRGWCTSCMGFVCGPKCAACVPFEVRLLWMEGKLPWGQVPVSVAVTAAPPRAASAGPKSAGGVLLGKG